MYSIFTCTTKLDVVSPEPPPDPLRLPIVMLHILLLLKWSLVWSLYEVAMETTYDKWLQVCLQLFEMPIQPTRRCRAKKKG